MYRIHGFDLSFNTWKVLCVTEELGIDHPYILLDPTLPGCRPPRHLRVTWAAEENQNVDHV